MNWAATLAILAALASAAENNTALLTFPPQLPAIGNGKCYQKNQPSTTFLTLEVVVKPVEFQTGTGDGNGCLSQMNAVRRTIGSPPLVWNGYLADSASSYASKLYSNNLGMVHSDQSKGGQYGENLYEGTGECNGAMIAWVVNERPKYSSGTGIGSGNFEGYGHYTQILFRPARAVGCSAPKEFGGYYVCHFDRIQSSGSVVY